MNETSLLELFSRRSKARDKHRHILPESARNGQVWVVAPQRPIFDSITGETIAVHVFLLEPSVDQSADWFYGFLTTRKEPNLERPIERWEFKGYMEMRNESFHRDCDWLPQESDPEADYLLLECPVFIHRDWLRYCVANFGTDCPDSIREYLGYWIANGGPGTAIDSSTQIGGHDIMDIVEKMKP